MYRNRYQEELATYIYYKNLNKNTNRMLTLFKLWKKEYVNLGGSFSLSAILNCDLPSYAYTDQHSGREYTKFLMKIFPLHFDNNVVFFTDAYGNQKCSTLVEDFVKECENQMYAYKNLPDYVLPVVYYDCIQVTGRNYGYGQGIYDIFENKTNDTDKKNFETSIKEFINQVDQADKKKSWLKYSYRVNNFNKLKYYYQYRIGICVMPYFDGVTLVKQLNNKLAHVNYFIALILLIENGIIHGDSHRGNVLINEDNEIKIIDFGLSIRCPKVTDTEKYYEPIQDLLVTENKLGYCPLNISSQSWLLNMLEQTKHIYVEFYETFIKKIYNVTDRNHINKKYYSYIMRTKEFNINNKFKRLDPSFSHGGTKEKGRNNTKSGDEILNRKEIPNPEILNSFTPINFDSFLKSNKRLDLYGNAKRDKKGRLVVKSVNALKKLEELKKHIETVEITRLAEEKEHIENELANETNINEEEVVKSSNNLLQRLIDEKRILQQKQHYTDVNYIEVQLPDNDTRPTSLTFKDNEKKPGQKDNKPLLSRLGMSLTKYRHPSSKEIQVFPSAGGKLRTKKRRYKKRNNRSKRRKSKVSKRIHIKKRNSTLKKY